MTEKKENETTKGPIPKNVHEVLHYVQMNLHAPKNQYNSFGKYSYRSCEDILEGLKKVLPPNAYVTICDDIVDIGGRIYVKATATLSYSGGEVKNSAFAREEESKKGMDSAQLTGATSSYARKYALNGLFLIDDTKDADSNESKEQAKNTPQQKQESNKPQAIQPQKNDSAALKELCARIKKQILECTTPETVNYVWGGFKADLDMIKQKAPTWFDALDAEYGKKLANVSQAPISDNEIPY